MPSVRKKTITDHAALSNIGTLTHAQIDAFIASKAQASGLASLDSGGKVPLAQLPASSGGGLNYLGTWNAATNTPSLSDGSGANGDYYVVSVAGTTSIDGENDWAIKDWIISNGSTWSKLDNTDGVIPASNNQFIYKNNSGVVEGHPNLFREQTYGGNIQTLIPTPDNMASFDALNSRIINIEPLQNSPDNGYSVDQISVNLDNNNSNFTFGTNGTCLNVTNKNVVHTARGDVGGINFLTQYVELGNGTDPLDVRGFGYAFGFGLVKSGVNISGAIQGYGFQPQFEAGSTIDDSDGYTLGFYDFVYAPSTTFGSYSSFSSGPTIGAIANNRNFSGINLNPTITNFLGNSGCTVIGINGDYGTFDTGYWQGININPSNITSVDNATGLYINMNNVTSGNKKAIEAVGDMSLVGNFSFTGALSIGQLQAFYQTNPVDGGGNPLNMHGLTTGLTALNGVTVANADAIGVNNAMLVTLEDNSVSTSGPFKLGFAAVALPCVVTTGAGSSLDYMNMAVYALNLAASTGGTIGRVNGVRVEAVPNANTTINEFAAFEFDQTFGQVGTDVWGLHVVPTWAENFIGGSLAIGTANEKVSNSNVALEIESTTKAFLPSRMTTTQRDALTALEGMVIYNLTTSKHEGYDGSSWNAFY